MYDIHHNLICNISCDNVNLFNITGILFVFPFLYQISYLCSMMKKLIIFDLDGTLLNTIDDLAAATNHALTEHGYPAHPVEAYNLFVGNGINKLFERALPEEARTPENILRIRTSFLPFYEAHKLDLTCPYDGIPELLRSLTKNNIQLAVASNKYQLATEHMVKYYFPDIPFVAVFGQREHVPIKPDPTVIKDILNLAKLNKENTLFVGDSGVDMLTAKRAHITAVGVTWGFRTEDELRTFEPDYIVAKPDEVRVLLNL
jgi:phosphoglycolate phosphatase